MQKKMLEAVGSMPQFGESWSATGKVDLGWKKWSGVRERIWLNSSLEGEENEPETI